MKVNGRKYTTATKQVNINGKTSNKRQQKQHQPGNGAEKTENGAGKCEKR